MRELNLNETVEVSGGCWLFDRFKKRLSRFVKSHQTTQTAEVSSPLRNGIDIHAFSGSKSK